MTRNNSILKYSSIIIIIFLAGLFSIYFTPNITGRVVQTGVWIPIESEEYTAGAALFSNTPNSSLAYNLSGEVFVVYSKRDDFGIAEVYVDGELVDTIDQYSANFENNIFRNYTVSSEIKVIVSENKNDLSSGYYVLVEEVTNGTTTQPVGVPEASEEVLTLGEYQIENLSEALNQTFNVTGNESIPTISDNQTSFLIETDKETYFPSEPINLFGEILTLKNDIEILLNVEFEEELVYSDSFNATNGSYFYTLNSSKDLNFKNEGQYFIKVYFENLSSETDFYLEFNASNLYSSSMDNMTCQDFKENILWSSGFTHDNNGKATYQTWYPQNNCSALGVENCFLSAIETNTRFLNFGENNKKGDGFIQMAELDDSFCNLPENGIYEKYLAQESLTGDAQSKGNYCGNIKNKNSKCEIEVVENNFLNFCYGIKSYASKGFLVDAVEVEYSLCYREDEK